MPPHGHSHGHSRGFHSGRAINFRSYEPEVFCYCDGVPCLCPIPDVGSLDTSGNPKPNTLERRSPLPAGHYWFDAFGLNIPKATNWLNGLSKLGVHTDATEHFPSSDLDSVRTWFLFTYTPVAGVPVVWDKSLGYPTITDSSVKSSQDTVSGADLPLSPLDEASNWLNSIEQRFGQAAPYAVLGGVAVGGFLLLKELGLFGKVKNVFRSKRTRSNRSAWSR